MPDTTTIYITKGAETHGIRKVEAEIHNKGGYAYGPRQGSMCFQPQFSPSEYRFTLAEATADAEVRRTKKLASLKKQIAAMEAIDLTKVKEG